MFDIGWSEMAVIALLTLIVIGPKELPRVLRTVGQWVRKAQSLAREFQRGLDDMAREADLEDAKKLIDTGRSIANPKKMVMDTLDPSASVGEEFKDLQKAMSADAPDSASTEKPDTTKPQTDEQSDRAAVDEAPAKDKTAKDKTAKATVVKQPVNVAPPDSITPPPEPTAEPKVEPTAEPTAEPKAKPKAKPRAKPKAKPAPKTEPAPEPATAGSDGSQKTA